MTATPLAAFPTRRLIRGGLLTGLLALCAGAPAPAADDSSSGTAVTAEYRDGLRIKSADGSFATRIRWRIQQRVTDLDSTDLVGEQDGIEEENGYRIRRP